MKTFEKEISYITNEVDVEKEELTEVTKTKVATFKELSRLDPEQHKLHFKLMSLFEGLEKSKDEENTIGISTDALYDMTRKSINILLIPNENFTEIDKRDFLLDSIALLQFGIWLFKNKFSPFFSTFKLS